MSRRSASRAGAVLLFAGLWGCAMPAAVQRADELYEHGDMAEAAKAYHEALEDSWLTRGEFAHASERLNQSAVAELQPRLQLMEARLAVRPPEELLEELSTLRAEQAHQLGSPEQDRMLEEVMQRVVARAWPEVEALLKQRKYHAALERAYRLASFFPRKDPLWREVERVREAARTWPELPTVSEPAFPPEAEPYMRIVQEKLEAGKPEEARVALVLAADASNLSVDEFIGRVAAVYGVYAPSLLQPVPEPPAPSKNVQAVESSRELAYGKVGRTAAAWGDLSTGDAVVARGSAVLAFQYSGLYLSAREIPVQRDRTAALFSYRMELAMLSNSKSDLWGWTFQDHVVVEAFVGRRISEPYVYPVGASSGQSEASLSFGGMLGWTALVGWRGRYMGLLVGAQPKLMGYQVGDVTAGGGLLPLTAWLELRWNERYPIVLEGWVSPVTGGNSTRGAWLRLPISPTWGLFARYEELRLESRMGGLKRSDRIDIDSRPSTLASLGFSLFM